MISFNMSGDMELNPGSLDDQAEIKQTLSQVDSTTFVGKDWNTVIMECHSLAAKWEQLSGYIGLSSDLIAFIKRNHPNDMSLCWNEALDHWIKQKYEIENVGKPSWRTLLKAIAMVNKRLFTKIAAGHQAPGEFKLHDASISGNLQEVMRLIEKEHLNPLQKNKCGHTAVHCAAVGGHLNVLRHFIEYRGCNAAGLDQNGRTLIHYAAKNNHLLVIQYLIEKQQVEPFSRDKQGRTALTDACAGGSIDVIRYLAKEMSKHLPLKDVVHDRDYEGMIPMHGAILHGHLDLIKFFITDLKCDPNTTDYKNSTCVHYSVQGGHLHILKYFIEQHHLDPSCSDASRCTPLHHAAYMGHQNIVQYLALEKHCDLMCTNENNDTPLHVAARAGQLEIVKFLVETCKCPIDIRGYRNIMTPLDYARTEGHHDIVEYLECIKS